MSGVNELFQNIRFLKFYGWGMYFIHGADDGIPAD